MGYGSRVVLQSEEGGWCHKGVCYVRGPRGEDPDPHDSWEDFRFKRLWLVPDWNVRLERFLSWESERYKLEDVTSFTTSR